MGSTPGWPTWGPDPRSTCCCAHSPIGPIAVSSYTVDQLNLTARQNFYSIYGFFEDPLETQVDAYRDGLDSEYRARFRIRETR